MIALGIVDNHLTVNHLGHVYRTVFLDLADLAAPAFLQIYHRHPLAYNTQVVKVRLYTVIGASAHGYLELMWQLHVVPSLIEPLVYGLRQGESVYQAVLAGSALAGHHRAHLGPCAAGLKAALFEESPQGLDVLKGHLLYLCCQAHGHGDLTVSELLGGLGYSRHLLGGHFAVAGYDPAVKAVGSGLVPEEPQALDPGYLLGGYAGLFCLIQHILSS